VPCDAAALEERLEAMLSDPDSLRRMGEAGRASVRRRFAWPELAIRLETVYADLAAGRPIGQRCRTGRPSAR
jgi:glycosyltransferase involved in cell wall biosynthesis